MNELRVTTYNAAQQHWGAYLSGFDWNAYGCGTYRLPVTEARASMLMDRFIERLTKKVKAPVSYFAACQHSDQLPEMMQTLWFKMFGNAKVDSYDATLAGAYYVSKLAAHPNGEFKFDKLELLPNKGPSDLLSAARDNAYVPADLKDRTHGEYLVVR